MSTPSERIEERVVLDAPVSRAWRAIADAAEFGSWFGVRLEGSFEPGARIAGPLTVPGYEHLTMELTVERVEPERLLSFRWHPYAVDPEVDYSAEPTTLVELRLEGGEAGTALTVVESGFDHLPPARRDEAFRRNAGGWAVQVENLRRHLAR